MKKNGFTIIELLVVTIIISLLSALTLFSFRTGEKQIALENATRTLSQDLRKSQELSMSAKSYDCGVGWRLKGYGINLVIGNDYYLLKTRCEEVASPGNYDDRILGEAIKLEEVKIKELKRDGSPIGTLTIFFYPPDPEIDFGGIDKVLITLCLKIDEGNTKNVSVNKTGLIAIK